MGYGDIHKVFLRSMWTKGVVTLEEAKNELLKGYPVQQQNIERFIHEINTEIEGMKQQIKVTPGEDGEDILVFVSLGNDGATRSQNIFSVAETEFFRVLMNEITGDEDRAVTGIDAVNLVNKMNHKLQKSDAERLLRIWTHMRYIQQDDNAYVLGPRTMIEFLGYLQKHMEDPPDNCSLCQTSVFKGVHCQFCGEAVHHRCIEKYVKKVHKWPCCRQPYDPDAQLVQIDDVNMEELEELPPLDLTELYDMDEDEAKVYRQQADEEINAAIRHAKRKRRNEEEGKAGPSRASSSRAVPSRASSSQAGPSKSGPSRSRHSQTGLSQAGPSQLDAGPSRLDRLEAGPSRSDQSEAGPSHLDQSEAGPSTSKAFIEISDDSSLQPSQQSLPNQRASRKREIPDSKPNSSQDDLSEGSPSSAEIKKDKIAEDVVDMFDESSSSSESSSDLQPHLSPAGRRVPGPTQTNRVEADSKNLLGPSSSQRRPLPNVLKETFPSTTRQSLGAISQQNLLQAGQSQAGSLQHKILKARTQVNPLQDRLSQADILACRSRVDSSPRFPRLYSTPVELNFYSTQLKLDMELYEAYASQVNRMELESSQAGQVQPPPQPQSAPLNIIDIGLTGPGLPLTYPEPANIIGPGLSPHIFQEEQTRADPAILGTFKVRQRYTAPASIINHGLPRPGPSNAGVFQTEFSRPYSAQLSTTASGSLQANPAPLNILALGSSEARTIKTEPPEDYLAPVHVDDTITSRLGLSEANQVTLNVTSSGSSQVRTIKTEPPDEYLAPENLYDTILSRPGPSQANLAEITLSGSSQARMIKTQPPEEYPVEVNLNEIDFSNAELLAADLFTSQASRESYSEPED